MNRVVFKYVSGWRYRAELSRYPEIKRSWCASLRIQYRRLCAEQGLDAPPGYIVADMLDEAMRGTA